MASHAGLIYVLETEKGYIDEKGNIVSNIEEAYPIEFYRFGFGPSAFDVYKRLGFCGDLKENEIRFHTITPSYEQRLSKVESFYKKLGMSLKDSIKNAHNDYYCYNLNDDKKFSEYINSKINHKYPGLSKGIYKKGGPGVNGVYNQDFSPYLILLEVGGYQNTPIEVLNSLLAFSECYMEVIKEYENK